MNKFNEHLALYYKEGASYLRANVPEIQRIEALDELHDLKLVKQVNLNDILILQYQATAPTLFPAVRQRLIDRGIAKRHDMLHTSVRNKGTQDEVYNVTMGFYGNTLQISLDVHR
ncbi:MAG TPA: hypothetical protein VJ461_03720 [Candidatus Nanoarchaeia archaeon]|nr:hypothetical protein [Candidatus Nanoarchaeia archaeon]